jgi:hypothetical protein
MKNKFSLATLVAMGLVIVSCTTDTDEVNSTAQKQNDGVYLKTADSINKTPATTYAGDNTIIPPIKP